MRRVLPIYILTTLVTVTTLLTQPGYADCFARRPQVLLLNSYHKGLPWSDGIVEGVESVLAEETDITIEYMDQKRFLAPDYVALLKQLYQRKYDPCRFDVIVSSDDNAFEFLLDYRDELFGDTPVVFCGVNKFRPEQLEGKHHFTGVEERLYIERNLELIFQLHPQTNHIIVLSDDTTNGLDNRRKLEQLQQQYPDSIQWSYYDHRLGLDATQMIELFSQAPRDAVVYYCDFFRDGKGNFVDDRRTVPQLALQCPCPIYVLNSIYLEYGVFGGYVVTGFYQGRTAAQLALQILHGTPAAAIPVVAESPNRYMFDYAALKRFHIMSSQLPEGSIIVNEPTSFFYRHRELTLYVALVFLGLLLLIVLLVSTILKLHRFQKQLRQSERRNRMAQVAANIYTWEWEPATDRLYCSEQVEVLLGLEPGQFKGTREALMECVHPDDRHIIQDAVARAIEGEQQYFAEHRVIWPDGQIRWFSASGDVERDEAGNVERLLGVVMDITERRQAEIDRENLLRTLQDKSDELQNVVYTTSHDLRSPLISIVGFSNELRDACQALRELIETEQSVSVASLKPYIERDIPDALQFITTSVDKMDRLLGGLLKVSRVGSRELRPRELDMNVLLDQIRQQLSFQINQAQAQVEIESLPPCYADPEQIEQLFTNLLDNAIKYRQPDEPLQVHIKGETKDGMAFYQVSDNGIGIDPAHQERVFSMFQRGQEAAALHGDGIGLAIVKRVVERHGGRIWVKSEPGQGATFHVMLRTQSEHHPHRT